MVFKNEKCKDYLTIGQLSNEIMEKSYDSAKSKKLPLYENGYPKKNIGRIKNIEKALQEMHRSIKVINKTCEDLGYLMRSGIENKYKFKNSAMEVELTLSNWLEAVQNYDTNLLSHGFHYIWKMKGPISFVIEYIVPFVKELGFAWKYKELTVSQEHFASELLGNFLSEKWKKLNEHKKNTNVVLANSPGENHKLGLQMCAVITATSKNGIVYLGLDNSCESIVSVFKESGATILGVSFSSSYNSTNVEKFLSQIRCQLSNKINIVLGGEGAPESIPRVRKFSDFYDYYKWLNHFTDLN